MRDFIGHVMHMPITLGYRFLLRDVLVRYRQLDYIIDSVTWSRVRVGLPPTKSGPSHPTFDRVRSESSSDLT